VEFGVLGPLEVRTGGQPVPVSAGKQRVLLAALLLRANQLVGVDALAEAVWEGRPPGTSRVTLQNYLMRLRQGLGPADRERIVTRPGGYLIKVAAGELDLDRFGDLCAAGRAAARAGAWDRASAQLGAALALWRGKPLADVPSRVLAQAEVPRLAEMRLEAVEARFDADLHRGRHQEMVAELQSLAAAEPLRERLHELLMLALYRSGQQAAALAAYRHARRQLIDELGIEPGPGLRDLNQRILRSDPGLLPAPLPVAAGSRAARPGGRARDGRSPAAGGRARPPRPAMLPAAVPGFAGRSRELRTLSAMPSRPGSPVVITAIGGTAGVGKTALAVHWARQNAAEFPDGQLYVNLRGFGPADPLPVAEALRGFLDALQVPAAEMPATLGGRQALYRTVLAGKRILIVLDNARDSAQARPLLPATPDALVLVTSRSQLTGLVAADGARPITVDVLTEADARQLIAQRLGPARIAAEPAAAAELTGLCARLPLALAITAARAATRPRFPLAALAAELRDARGRLDALATGEDATDARAVFSWSYHQLSPATARLFRLLGLHPGPDITAPAAASLAGATLAAARHALAELARCHLITEPAPGRYACHDLLRAYAAEQAHASEDEEARRSAIHRMLDHYLHTAHAAALLLSPPRQPVTLAPPWPGVTPEHLADHQQALDWFEAEHQALLAAATLAAETGFDACAWQLPWAMMNFLDRRGRWHDLAASQRAAVAAAARLGDQAGQAAAHRFLATACIRLADYDEARAHLADCLLLCRELGDHTGEARAHLSLTIVSERQDRHADALGHAEQALGLFRAAADHAGEAAALNTVGWCHTVLGDPQQARSVCQQGLALQRQLGNRHGEAATWDSLGYAEHQLGNLADATACYQHALGLFRELGDRYSEAEILTHLGDTHHAAGDRPGARDAWQQALDILDDLHHPDAGQVRAKLRQATGDRHRARHPAPVPGSPASAALS
jgi:DNA-binding SARP family transcriptional activator